jgi:uncharacterized protein (DUF952 family)
MDLLHLTTERQWQSALADGHYRGSTRDASVDEVGFVHCSRTSQLPRVASAVYTGISEPLVVLHLDDEALTSADFDVVIEDGGDGESFPHVYGGPLPVSVVAEVRPATVSDDGTLNY